MLFSLKGIDGTICSSNAPNAQFGGTGTAGLSQSRIFELVYWLPKNHPIGGQDHRWRACLDNANRPWGQHLRALNWERLTVNGKRLERFTASMASSHGCSGMQIPYILIRGGDSTTF